jgi:NAD(P)-dependent dehydrogenase (short-subunit alcohol dehydrogenase family)
MSAPSPSTLTAIITGAAQGIGYSIALRLANDGIDIALNDIREKAARLEEVVKEIELTGRRCIVVPGDVSKEEDVKEMVERTAEELGGVDIVSTMRHSLGGV